MNVAMQGCSYLSLDEYGDLSKEMLPDPQAAQQFKVKETKLSWVISHSLGLMFHRNLVEDVKQCERSVLCFDEQKNHQNDKQSDIL